MARRLSTSRFKSVRAGHAIVLAADHPAMVENRPLFTNAATADKHRHGVGPVYPGETVLKSGANNRKIHSVRFGIPDFTLTLRERTDCPLHCAERARCLGNHEFRHRRYEVTSAFYRAVRDECELNSLLHPDGWRLRLHVLGDFISPAYVRFWAEMLAKHEPLGIWGYTHWRKTDPIGRELEKLNRQYQHGRFCIRWSGGHGAWSTRVFDTHSDERVRDGYTMCAHEFKGIACADCTLCWTSPKPIGFTAH